MNVKNMSKMNEKVDESVYLVSKSDQPIQKSIRLHVKNLFWQDRETTAGSTLLKKMMSGTYAVVLQNLLKYRWKIFSINTLDEFGNGSRNESSLYGMPTEGEKLGGSSGGTAWAVNRYDGLGVGTDTGGSVRDVTHSFPGLIGLKTSWNLISRVGLIDYCNPLDTVGFLSKNIDLLRLAVWVNLREERKQHLVEERRLQEISLLSLRLDLYELQEIYLYWTSVYFYSNMQRFKLLDFSEVNRCHGYLSNSIPKVRERWLNDLTLSRTLAPAARMKYLMGWLNLVRGGETSLLEFSKKRLNLKRYVISCLKNNRVMEVPLRIQMKGLDRNVWLWIANLCGLPSVSYGDRCFIGGTHTDLSLLTYLSREFDLT